MQHTAGWSRESLGADCLVVSVERSQSLWFLSQSSHSHLWRAGSTKQFETRTAIIFLSSAELVHSSSKLYIMTDQVLVTHVGVKQFYSCFVKNSRVRTTEGQIIQSSEKHSNSLSETYDPASLHSSQRHKLCLDRKKSLAIARPRSSPIPPV